MFKAVIFDFDGVVADTMNDNFMAWKDAILNYRVEIEPIEYYLLEGMGRFQIARFFIHKYGLNPLIEKDMVEAKESNYVNKNNFKIYPEIFSMFDLLEKKNVKIAIATGASRDRINRTLSASILSKVSVLVTSDDIKNTKPHPEPYNKVIQKLNLINKQCLVIENAKLGIESAKSAGCTCFAIETTLEEHYLEGADEIFVNHADLLSRFEEIFK